MRYEEKIQIGKEFSEKKWSEEVYENWSDSDYVDVFEELRQSVFGNVEENYKNEFSIEIRENENVSIFEWSEVTIENLIEEVAQSYDFEEEFNSDDFRKEIIKNVDNEDNELIDEVNSLNFIAVKRDSKVTINYFNKHASIDDYIVVDIKKKQ